MYLYLNTTSMFSECTIKYKRGSKSLISLYAELLMADCSLPKILVHNVCKLQTIKIYIINIILGDNK